MSKECDCNFGLCWGVLVIVALVQSCGSVDENDHKKLKKEVATLERKLTKLEKKQSAVVQSPEAEGKED